jgi:LPXTG-motif cell wall-anchored protein
MKMNTIFSAIGLILLIAIGFFISRKKPSDPIENQNQHSETNSTQKKADPKAYVDLRQMAFDVDPEKLGISFSSNETKVFGVIMDIDMRGGIATLVSYSSGDASLYLSIGGGVIGGGQHESVNVAARAFTAKAQNYISKAAKIKETPAPEKGGVNIYLLTNSGKYLIKEQVSKFNDETSPLLPLFYAGNDVITQLRILSSK